MVGRRKSLSEPVVSGDDCLSEEEFLEISLGGGGPLRASHLARCAACREVAALLLSGTFSPGDAAPMGPLPFDLLPGDFCDRFEILSFLGQGGMGTVYRAHDPALNRDVALKVTPFSEAFLHHEARAMARIRDPRVVAIHEVVARPYVRRRGAAEQSLGTGYLVMEWIDGSPLRSHAISTEDVARVLFDIAQAIHAVHAAGVVHGDVKPDNVLIVRSGGAVCARLGDFGLAQCGDQEGASARGGTRGYAAPELLRGAPPTIATDIFAYSTLARELLADRSAVSTSRFLALVAAGSASDPAERPPSMAPFVNALRPRSSPNRWFVGVALGALLAGLTALSVLQIYWEKRVALRPLRELPVASPAGTHLVDITIENHRDSPISIVWIDFDGHRVPYQTVGPGGVAHQETYSGHVWAVEMTGSAPRGFVAPAHGTVVSVD